MASNVTYQKQTLICGLTPPPYAKVMTRAASLFQQTSEHPRGLFVNVNALG